MIVLNNEQAFSYHPIIKYIPSGLRRYLMMSDITRFEEIRLKRGLPLSVCMRAESFFITRSGAISKSTQNAVCVSDKDIMGAISLISDCSMYAFEECIKNGYITVENGCRVGICGDIIMRDEKVSTIKNISGLNYRLAREIKGVGESVAEKIIDRDRILNTLIISPPGCGKTTLLRDLSRILSDKGYKVSIADERNEISAMHNGRSGFDLGALCDVMQGGEKAQVIELMLRTMSPQVIITDELGGENDVFAIKKATRSGVAVVATIHASCTEDVKKSDKELYNSFNCFITLGKNNKIEGVYCDI